MVSIPLPGSSRMQLPLASPRPSGPPVSAPAVRAVEFQTVSHCNGRCYICPWPDVRGTEVLKAMPDGVWDRLLEGLAELRPGRVIPYLNNEPLIDQGLEERIVQVLELLPEAEIEVSTNGILLTPQRTEGLLRAGVTDLHVSIFGWDRDSHRRIMGLDYDRTCANVEAALELRDLMAPEAVVRVIQVAIPGLDEDALDAALAVWADRGAEVDRYGYLDRSGNVPEDIQGGAQRDRTLTPRGCELNRHRERLYVLVDGTVTFCCHDWRRQWPMGSLRERTLTEIWQADGYRRLRAQVDGRAESPEDFLCRSCKLCLA
jgi:MoaA/NifB/PqqE/SkfB family radical SAM enzyme